MKKPIRKRNDALLKGIFEENFSDLLHYLYPDALEIFDFDLGFTFMDKELLQLIPDRERNNGTRIADLLVKVHLKNKEEKWIMIHTEIEGGSQPDFGLRIFTYHYRILDHHQVPVETIAFFTGDKNQKCPNSYAYSVVNTSLHFKYMVYSIFDQSEEELLQMDNIFALVVLACQKSLLEGKVSDQELAAYRNKIARTLLQSKKYSKERIINFLYFLKNFIFVKNIALDTAFNNYIYQVSGGTIKMGVIEIVKQQERALGKEEGLLEGKLEGLQEGKQLGLQEGKQLGLQEGKQLGFQEGKQLGFQEGKQLVVSNFLKAGSFSHAQIAQITGVPISYVQQLEQELKNSKK